MDGAKLTGSNPGPDTKEALYPIRFAGAVSAVGDYGRKPGVAPRSKHSGHEGIRPGMPRKGRRRKRRRTDIAHLA